MVNVRKSLLEGTTEDTKYRCIGAVEIQFRMHELGYSEDETPSLSTIKRIIKRNGLIVQKRKRYIRCKSKKRYTLLNPTKANEVHQIDFVGPRHIKGYGRISSLNLIDVVSSKAHIHSTQGRALPQRRILEDFEIDVHNLPITEGKVHFIRQVKENGTISVLNEDFDIDKSLAYEYVWATIDTKQEQLMSYYREKNAEDAGLIKICEYKIGENVKRFDEKF